MIREEIVTNSIKGKENVCAVALEWLESQTSRRWQTHWKTSAVADGVFVASTTRPLADNAGVQHQGRRGENKHSQQELKQFVVLWQNQKYQPPDCKTRYSWVRLLWIIYPNTRFPLSFELSARKEQARTSLGFISGYRALMWCTLTSVIVTKNQHLALLIFKKAWC